MTSGAVMTGLWVVLALGMAITVAGLKWAVDPHSWGALVGVGGLVVTVVAATTALVVVVVA